MYQTVLFRHDPIPRQRRGAWFYNPFGGVSTLNRLYLIFLNRRDHFLDEGYSFDYANDAAQQDNNRAFTYMMGLTGPRDIRYQFAYLSGRLAYIQGWARVMLARLARRRRIERDFAPGGAGYLRARENFQILAGQRRQTRRFRPY